MENPVHSLSPCQEPVAGGWKCTFSQQPNVSAKNPVTSQDLTVLLHHTLFSSSLCGPGGSQFTALSSQQHCPALGMAAAPRPQTSLQEWAAVMCVELLTTSEPCNVLKPSGPRDKAPLSSFSFFPEKAFLHNVHF